MKTIVDKAVPKLTVKGSILIILGAALFPALILLPFLIHSSQRVFVLIGDTDVAGKPLGLHCLGHPVVNGIVGGYLDKVNQCVAWNAPASIHRVVLLDVLAFLILGIFTLVYTRRQSRLAFKRFALVSSLTAVIVTVVSIVAYAMLHGSSQQAYGLFSANQLPDGSYVVSHPPTLGYGLAPVHVVLFSALYLLIPLANLINYYRPMIDPRYIGGVKKKELFQ